MGQDQKGAKIMKHEQTILRGIIIALALAAIVGVAATAVAVGRISELRYELTEAQSDADTYREGYAATLARVEELEWQLDTMNGGVGE